MILFYKNLINALATADITFQSQDVGFPAINLKNDLRTVLYKTSGSNLTQFVALDFFTAATISAVIMLDHTHAATDTVTLEASTAADFSSIAFSQALTYAAGTMAATFAPQTYRFWRYKWTQTGAGVRSFGRLFLGSYYTCPVGTSYDGYTRDEEDLSIQQRSVGGQIFADIRGRFRRLTLDLDSIPQVQADEINTLKATVGKHTSFFLVIDEGAAGELIEKIYVKFSNLPKLKSSGTDDTGAIAYDTRLEVEEQL